MRQPTCRLSGLERLTLSERILLFLRYLLLETRAHRFPTRQKSLNVLATLWPLGILLKEQVPRISLPRVKLTLLRLVGSTKLTKL